MVQPHSSIARVSHMVTAEYKGSLRLPYLDLFGIALRCVSWIVPSRDVSGRFDGNC